MLSKKKKITISIILVLILIIISPLIFLYFPRRVANMLPEEKITKVILVVEQDYYAGSGKTKVELSADKITLFEEKLGQIWYVPEAINIYRHVIWDSVKIFITYETCSVELSDHHLIVRNNVDNNIVRSRRILVFFPTQTYNELTDTFIGGSIILD